MVGYVVYGLSVCALLLYVDPQVQFQDFFRLISSSKIRKYVQVQIFCVFSKMYEVDLYRNL